MQPTESSPPFNERDPLSAIVALQRSEQRFWPGFVAMVVVAVAVVAAWALKIGPVDPSSKTSLVAALVGGVIVALPLRWVGRVSELKLAVVAGVSAALAIWLGDVWARSLGGGPLVLLPHDGWWVYLLVYGVTAWVATSTARNDLRVEASLPSSNVAGTALPPPQTWEDPNAKVLQEAASVYRNWVTVPGELLLTSRFLKFADSGGNEPGPFILLSDVQGADRSVLPNAMAITMLDGTTHRFVTFDPDKWVVQINARISAARAMEAHERGRATERRGFE